MSTARYEITDQENGVMPELKYITHSRYDNEWLSVIHSHSIAEMIYVVSGEGMIVTGDRRRSIGKDDFVLIPPHLMHTEISSSQNPLEYICLGISNITLASDEREFDPLLNLSSLRENVYSIIVGIYREMQKKQPEYEMMARSLFYQLLVLLIRRRVINVGIEEIQEMRSNIADVKSYIDEHYAEAITLDELASIAALSKYHLIREFKAAVGTSPMEYLLEKRITESKKLLAGTEHSISDIADSVGFSSGSYFSQRFRLITGMTPLKFRLSSHGGVA